MFGAVEALLVRAVHRTYGGAAVSVLLALDETQVRIGAVLGDVHHPLGGQAAEVRDQGVGGGHDVPRGQSAGAPPVGSHSGVLGACDHEVEEREDADLAEERLPVHGEAGAFARAPCRHHDEHDQQSDDQWCSGAQQCVAHRAQERVDLVADRVDGAEGGGPDAGGDRALPDRGGGGEEEPGDLFPGLLAQFEAEPSALIQVRVERRHGIAPPVHRQQHGGG